MTSEQMVDFLERLVRKISNCSIEDGLDEDDWNGWDLQLKH